jgi:hypothetical protein
MKKKKEKTKKGEKYIKINLTKRKKKIRRMLRKK